MRIVSYNILDGGEGRADPLAEVIEAHRPDIVVLVEADNQSVLDRISSRLKMDMIHAEGKRHGVAILSHWKITQSINHSLLHPELTDSVLEATIVDPAGVERIIAAIHLHAHALEADEQIREREMDTILNIFSHHRQSAQLHILAGDFNANAPIQQIVPENCKPSTRKEWEANGGKIPRVAIQKLLDSGYIDSLQTVKGDGAGKIGSFTTQYPGQRIDYIFAYGIAEDVVTGAGIEQDRLAKYASDHFPVFMETE